MKLKNLLNGKNWTLEGVKDGRTIRVENAAVPGNIVQELYENGICPPPFFELNYRKVAWAGESEFDYSLTLDASAFPESGDGEKLFLCFDSIDTYSDVFLNGHFLGSSVSQYMPCRFDITQGFLREGVNEIKVKIKPVLENMRKWCAENRIEICPTVAAFDDWERVYARKAAMTFGWDNCPRILAGGIVKDVYLLKTPKYEIADWTWKVGKVDIKNAGASLAFRLDLKKFPESAKVRISGKCGASEFCRIFDAETDFEKELEVENAKFWWPNGHGEQNIYNIKISLLDGDSKILDEIEDEIAIRKVEFVTSPAVKKIVDYRIGRVGEIVEEVADGGNLGPWERVHLKTPEEVEARPLKIFVNGKRVFAKGTDWEHPYPLMGVVRSEKTEALVRAAKECNMNMLRVWGGGVIECPEFFKTCLREGIMVWHDFFFACAIYPRDTAFLDLLKSEAQSVVLALRNYAAVVSWCGDNESDMIEYDAGRDYSQNTINKKLLPGVLKELDFQERYYHTSSPCGGPYPRSDFGGDKRNWGGLFPQKNYWHIRQESCVFMSEGGGRSLPGMDAVRRDFSKENMSPFPNEIWKLHSGDLDGHVRGDWKSVYECMKFFDSPETDNIEEQVEVSQFAHAWSNKLLVEQCRRRMDSGCDGILVWKLADQWTALDHGLLDGAGIERMCFAATKNAFKETVLSITQDWQSDESPIEVWAVNEGVNPLKGSISLFEVSTDGREKLLETFETDIGANTACKLKEFENLIWDKESSILLVRFEGNGKHLESYWSHSQKPLWRFYKNTDIKPF